MKKPTLKKLNLAFLEITTVCVDGRVPPQSPWPPFLSSLSGQCQCHSWRVKQFRESPAATLDKGVHERKAKMKSKWNTGNTSIAICITLPIMICNLHLKLSFLPDTLTLSKCLFPQGAVASFAWHPTVRCRRGISSPECSRPGRNPASWRPRLLLGVRLPRVSTPHGHRFGDCHPAKGFKPPPSIFSHFFCTEGIEYLTFFLRCSRTVW